MKVEVLRQTLLLLSTATQKITEHSSLGSDTTTTTLSQSASATSTEFSAPQQNFNVGEMTAGGTDFVGQVINDNTKKGIKFGPTLQILSNRQQSVTESPLAKTDVGCESWQEVMQPCRLLVNKIIRKIDDGVIQLDSVLWDKNRTEIIGKFAETTYQLKQGQTSWAIHTQHIPNEVLCVVALAVTIATPGVGGSLFSSAVTGKTGGTMVATTRGMAMASAAFTTLCSQAATSFLSHGDLAQTGKDLFSSQGLWSLAKAVATAGLVGDGGTLTGLNLTQRLAIKGFKNLVKASVSAAIEKRDIGECLKNGGISALVDSISGVLAQNIGEAAASKTDPLSPFTHKVAHFGLGAAMGAALDRDNPLAGAVTGGLGAVIAEVVAESLVDRTQLQRDVLKEMKEAGIPESTPGYKETAYQQKLRPYMDTARLVAASVIAASEHHPAAAIATATNALENNFAGDPWPEIGSLPDETREAVREAFVEAVVEEAEGIWNDPDTFVEETTIGFVPGGDIARKLHRGERVTYLDLAREASVTCMPYVGGAVKGVGKTGAKIINKVALKVTQKLEKAAKSGKAAGRSTNLDALDLASVSRRHDCLSKLAILKPKEAILNKSQARREAMRKDGIPTSQQPSRQFKTDAGYQYEYEVPTSMSGAQKRVVTDQTTDRVVGHSPHWEAGKAKAPERMDPLGRLRVENDKVKVEYNSK